MAKNRSKRYEAAKKAVDPARKYPLAEAIKVLKSMPPAKYDMTVTLSMHLGVDPKQSDQMVRGTTPLPHGSGKAVRVLVFASGAAAEAARAAGAEFVVMTCGDIMTMPGLPKEPASSRIDIDDNGRISGLF